MITVHTVAGYHHAIDEKARWEFDKDTLNHLYSSLIIAGFKKIFPRQKPARAQFVIELHKNLTVFNAAFPKSVRFDQVYDSFLPAFEAAIHPLSDREVGTIKRELNEWLRTNRSQFVTKKEKKVIAPASIDIAKLDYETILPLFRAICKIKQQRPTPDYFLKKPETDLLRMVFERATSLGITIDDVI